MCAYDMISVCVTVRLTEGSICADVVGLSSGE